MKDPATSGIQSEQEDGEHIGVIGIGRHVPGQLARSECDHLGIGAARVRVREVVAGPPPISFRAILVRDPFLHLRIHMAGDGGVRRETKEQHWNREQRTCPDQQGFGRGAAKEEQHNTEQRVIVQDVAVPHEQEMRYANQEQHA